MKMVDLHCDTVDKLMDDPAYRLAENEFAIDLNKMEKAGSLAQVFALFVNMKEVESPSARGYDMLQRLWQELDRNEDRILWAGNASDLRKNKLHDKMSAMIAIEEGGVLEGEIGNLHNFYRQGVRFVTLTWNYPNEIGFPHGAEHGMKGLTTFGHELIEEMERIGVITDVSHLSEAGFWDVKKTLEKPFVATHSNCQALCNHSRNLTDEQIKALSESGGVMGINIFSKFLIDSPTPDSDLVEAAVAHVKHAIKIGGIDVVALGGDLDGIPACSTFKTIGDMGKIEQSLLKHGFKENEIEKIWSTNAIRVMDAVLK